MGDTTDLTPTEAVAALEHFVIDNDELFELEERIGRFNIFDALGIAKLEIKHSNFLAWLLDPRESHGQGDLFLRAVLMDLLRQCPVAFRPLNPVQLDGVDLRDVKIWREWEDIDLVIVVGEPRLVVVVENKIGSGEGDGQLRRYASVCASHFPMDATLRVLLTIDGDSPSEDDWIAYSYSDIHRVISRLRRINAGAIGGEVDIFLEHYLRLLKGRLMNDEQIDELCRRIYQNHRQALKLIFDRVVVGGSNELLTGIEDWLRSDSDRWHVFNVTTKQINCVPRSWLDWIPPLGVRSQHDPRWWVRFWVDVAEESISLHFVVSNCEDQGLRKRLVDRLCRDANEFGLEQPRRDTIAWMRLFSKQVLRFPQEEPPSVETVVAELAAALNKLMKQLSGLEDAVRRDVLAKA